MELEIKKPQTVNAKILKLHLKVSDNFTADLISDKGDSIFSQDDGYVPGFMPGEHYGDYVILDIDIDDGRIINWVRPTIEDVQEWINGDDE